MNGKNVIDTGGYISKKMYTCVALVAPSFQRIGGSQAKVFYYYLPYLLVRVVCIRNCILGYRYRYRYRCYIFALATSYYLFLAAVGICEYVCGLFSWL